MACAPHSRSLAVVNPHTGVADYHIEPLDGAAVAALASRLRAAQPALAALSLASLSSLVSILGLPVFLVC